MVVFKEVKTIEDIRFLAMVCSNYRKFEKVYNKLNLPNDVRKQVGDPESFYYDAKGGYEYEPELEDLA